MKKLLLILGIVGILVLGGCDLEGKYENRTAKEWASEYKTLETKLNDNLVNTYRDTKLLFEIKYPKNWQIADYINFDKFDDKCAIYKQKNFISEKYGKDIYELCDEGTTFQISSIPIPYGGFTIDNTPNNFESIYVKVLPVSTYFNNQDEDKPNAVLKESYEYDVGGKDKLTILAYDAKNYSEDDEMFPHIIGYYYGDNYLYEFFIDSEKIAEPLSPNDSHLKLFKEILSTFKEIR